MKRYENKRVLTGDHYHKGPQEIMTEMGRMGWELVSVIHTNFPFGGRYQELFFKRELQEQNSPADYVI